MTLETSQAAVFEPSLGLAEQIADYVQNQIVSGKLVPGERIAEARVTADLGVSRGPVRESMRILARRHLVELLPRKGARVSEFGAEDVNALYDLQQALMTLLVRKVGSVWQPADLERFANLQKNLAQAVNDEDALSMISLSFEFQRAACEIVQNAYLTAALFDLQPSFSRAYYRALSLGRQEMNDLAEFISQLISHIVEDDVSAGEALVKRFSEHQRKLVVGTFDSV